VKHSLKQALDKNKPLILPIAHDALTARIIEEAGFDAYSIGGLPMIASRYAMPDIGIVSFGEMVEGVRDIMRGSDLPVLVDADEGYGDVKSVTRTVQTYEAMGVAGISLEDQTSPKRCGHMQGKSVVSIEVASRKLSAALAARKNPDFLIQARIDSRSVYGLEDAIHRAEIFADLGADILFIEAPQSREEIELIPRQLRDRVPLAINMSTLGVTPYVSPPELANLGYSLIVCPGAILVNTIQAIKDTVQLLKEGKLLEAEEGASLSAVHDLVRIGRWQKIDESFGDDPA